MHPIDPKGKFFTKTELIHANNAAIREGRNRALKEDFLESLPDDNLFPITLALDEHNRGEIRVQIIFDENGTIGFLDLSKNRYDTLSRAIFKDEETVEFKHAKKPYPSDREYVEKTTRHVIRDKNFRDNVLSAYGYQCAICEANDIATLVAAHIYPAHLCGDDTVNNGICLCSNHDKRYERGIICIRSNGDIFSRSQNVTVDFDKIRLPENKDEHPSPERLNQRLKMSMKKKQNDES